MFAQYGHYPATTTRRRSSSATDTDTDTDTNAHTADLDLDAKRDAQLQAGELQRAVTEL
jgi:hypothetical protein